ncbi:uncharacterized protein LOC144574429 [Carex rostrata]
MFLSDSRRTPTAGSTHCRDGDSMLRAPMISHSPLSARGGRDERGKSIIVSDIRLRRDEKNRGGRGAVARVSWNSFFSLFTFHRSPITSCRLQTGTCAPRTGYPGYDQTWYASYEVSQEYDQMGYQDYDNSFTDYMYEHEQEQIEAAQRESLKTAQARRRDHHLKMSYRRRP